MSYLCHTQNRANYLIKRGSTYYFSVKLEGKIFRKSLKTDIRAIAQEIVQNVVNEIREFKKVSFELLKAVVDNQVETAISAATAVLYPRSVQGQNAIKAHYIRTIQRLSNGFTAPSVKDLQTDKLKSKSSVPQLEEGDSGWEQEYTQANAELEILDIYKQNLVQAFESNDLVAAHSNLEALKQTFNNSIPEQEQATPTTPTTPTFSEALNTWVHDKSSNLYLKKNKPVSSKASDEKIKYLSGLILHLWKDKPIEDIDGKEIDRAFRLYAQFPLTKHNPWKSMSLEERIEAAESGDVPEDQRVGKTLVRIKTAVNLFFDHFWRLGVIDNNPVKDMRFKDFVDGGQRGAFNKAQLSLFQTFATSNELDGFKVAILLQMYTGMRNSEIANITPDGIKQYDGIDYIHVRGTKTVNAERYIPIHDKLKELGVVEYIKQGGEIIASQSITQRFNRLMATLNMPNEDEKGLPLSFYSFRHNFASGLASGGVSELHIEWLMGHSHTGTKQRYIDRGVEHVPALAASVKCLDYGIN